MTEALRTELDALRQVPPDVAPGERGLYLEFQVPPQQAAALEKLENRPKHIELVAVRTDEQVVGGTLATVFVPESHSDFFAARIREYRDNEARSGKPRHEALVARIEHVRPASVRSFFTDDPNAFPLAGQEAWWEVWLRRGTETAFIRAATAMQVRVNEHSIAFPEREVRIALASAEQMQQLIRRSDAVAELRLARDNPSIFLSMRPEEERVWVEALRDRLVGPTTNEVAVCLLDCGVTRNHPLLELFIDASDVHTCVGSWGLADNPRSRGHGTAMAGLCLFGDLVEPISVANDVTVPHRLESVKILPPHGRNEPDSYGAITLEAIARAEVQQPQRKRPVCLAITNYNDVAHGRPSAWSAAIDQACYNAGDNQRLVLISAGNVRVRLTAPDYPSINDLTEVESPGQAWNALTVGAFTDKVNITEGSYRGWAALAPAGDLSPRTRTSLTWTSQWPVKPDIVLEGGNLAHDGSGGDALDIDDLCVLTTSDRITQSLLTSFGDTSAATALASRMAAQVWSERPTLRAETVRALLVHAARWTPAMRRCLGLTPTIDSKRTLLRRYGYGIPSLDRAIASTRSDLTLVIEDQLRPLTRQGSTVRMREMQLHQLPWPREALEALGNTPVELQVTLSYFVEPNPGERGWTKRHRYASHGLRFDVKGSLETLQQFEARINSSARDEEEDGSGALLPSDRWFLNSLRNKGSVHSDVWTGVAADLATRDAIGIYPVSGWWKEKPGLARWDRAARYTLLVSLRVPETDVDIYTPVRVQIEQLTSIAV